MSATPLQRAREKVGEQLGLFIDLRATVISRESVAKRWGLSFEELDALEVKYAAEIKAAVPRPTSGRFVSGVERSLPPGDRE